MQVDYGNVDDELEKGAFETREPQSKQVNT
jgi:hypothetical protein